MTDARVTRFSASGNGGRSLGIVVGGVRVNADPSVAQGVPGVQAEGAEYGTVLAGAS